jgi:hypothetical protein
MTGTMAAVTVHKFATTKYATWRQESIQCRCKPSNQWTWWAERATAGNICPPFIYRLLNDKRDAMGQSLNMSDTVRPVPIQN